MQDDHMGCSATMGDRWLDKSQIIYEVSFREIEPLRVAGVHGSLQNVSAQFRGGSPG
jgi:hypothetical protein